MKITSQFRFDTNLGNLPNLLNRILAHKKALGAVLHTGTARHHRGNPAASLRVEKLYAASVLLSGLATQILMKSEVDMVEQHHKVTLEGLMRLHPRTPRCVVAFLGGSLPGSALIHLRMFSLFGMICRSPYSILHSHAINILTVAKSSSKSWFLEIRTLSLQYRLPHPLTLLQSPPSKDSFKKLVNHKVVDYWETKLREEAKPLTSLKFFKPHFMSLTAPHPIWTTAGSSPYQVAMSTVQGTMISGRYRTEQLCSNFANDKTGFCQTTHCKGLDHVEDLQHILADCPALEETRTKLKNFTTNYSQSLPVIQPFLKILSSPSNPSYCQFLVDCSVLPEVISATQTYGPQLLDHLFKITRTWCYCLHRTRLRILGRWQRFH